MLIVMALSDVKAGLVTLWLFLAQRGGLMLLKATDALWPALAPIWKTSELF